MKLWLVDKGNLGNLDDVATSADDWAARRQNVYPNNQASGGGNQNPNSGNQKLGRLSLSLTTTVVLGTIAIKATVSVVIRIVRQVIMLTQEVGLNKSK